MNLKLYLTGDKFGLLIDLRSMADQFMHGSGVRLVNPTDGVQLELVRDGNGFPTRSLTSWITNLNLYSLPLNALIVGPTNSGKTRFLVNQLSGPFCGKFDYIALICPTFAYNKMLYRFADRDPRLYVIICEQHQVEAWLKVAVLFLEGTNSLIVLDDCAASKEVKGRTRELVKLGFCARHSGLSMWVLTQQLSNIAKPFREKVAAIVLFYTPSAKTTNAIFKEYAASCLRKN